MEDNTDNDRGNENRYTHEAYQNSNLNENPNNHDITNPNDPSGTNPKRYNSFDAEEDATDSGNRSSNFASQHYQHTYSNEDDRQLGKRERLNDENDDSEDEINLSTDDNEKFFDSGF